MAVAAGLLEGPRRGPESPILLEAAIKQVQETGISLAALAGEATLPHHDVEALALESAHHRPEINF